ncbi:GNAT family N-acetyltransferase [Fusibacter sp. 3D3]|uniref:GNAT family N-acetyltransferase n=1 Tax=Fusibacter sp. 3D3 TaxID=1048380 RepID=UPI000855E59E|nr:GNAT family N-acetyltransferase [Fusibacter sp. 3D3]GAU79145.1 putative acetyltransferase [Fusibacter sp. 3D3]
MRIESNLKAVLLKIAKQLNEAKVTWAVGASIVLDYYGLLEESPHDIDLIIQIDDIEKVDALLKGLGEKQSWEKSDQYSTPYFYEYKIEGIKVDVMALLTINTIDGKFTYHFNEACIKSIWKEDHIVIPLTPLEDWFVLYALMGNREEKVKLIETYFKDKKIEETTIMEELKHQGILPEALMKRLSAVKENINVYIRPARPDEFAILNEVASISEAHWGYDESFMNEFRTFYAINAAFISENPTFVYLRDNQIIAFYGLILKGRFCELEYFYVRPDYIGKGMGASLWQHMLRQCALLEIEVVTLVTSPEAKAFYEKMGAVHSGDTASLIKAGRMIPKLYYKLDWMHKA